MIPTYTYLRKEKSHFMDRRAIHARSKKKTNRKKRRLVFRKHMRHLAGKLLNQFWPSSPTPYLNPYTPFPILA